MDVTLLRTRLFAASTPVYLGLLLAQILVCMSSFHPQYKLQPDTNNFSRDFENDSVENAQADDALNTTRKLGQLGLETTKQPCLDSNTSISRNVSKENASLEETARGAPLVSSNEFDFKARTMMNDSNSIQGDGDIIPILPDPERSKVEALNLSLQAKSSSSHTLHRLPDESKKNDTKSEDSQEIKQDNTSTKRKEFFSSETPTLHMQSVDTLEERDIAASIFESNSSVDDQRESNSSVLGRKVSSLLDSLLLGYDRRLRPGFGRTPLTVKADMEIRSMGPISEKDMIFSMDCYFRQNWVDRRLAFNATEEQVTKVSLNLKMLERIWHPDTYFVNGGPSYVHTITTPNKFVRLFYDGSVLFSQRLTIKATCPMHLEKFPMDSQLCPLHIASFGYSAADVIYEWHYGNALAAVASTDMRLSQFDLKGMPASNSTRSVKGSPHSILTVYFDFRRHTGFFLIQVYLPCCLLVILSWVSFWINREATSDRISLGATTMLTMTFLVLDSRNDLPRVAYSTALDVYVALCFVFVFASIVQFAAVHFYTKYGTADSDFKASIMPDSEDSESDSEESCCDQGCFTSNNQTNFRHPMNSHQQLKPDSLTACIRKMWSCLLSTRTKRFNKNVRNALGLNSVSKIDTMSRVLFPSAFIGLNIVYWILYW